MYSPDKMARRGAPCLAQLEARVAEIDAQIIGRTQPATHPLRTFQEGGLDCSVSVVFYDDQHVRKRTCLLRRGLADFDLVASNAGTPLAFPQGC